MAFSTMFTVKKGNIVPVGTPLRVYNFDRRVTTFGGGDRDDVMLLQALFRILYYEFMGFGSPDAPSGSTGVIKIDGIVGRQTRLHIEHYQQLLLKEGNTKTTDGVIDPFKKQGVLTSNTQVKYQLELLNVDCLIVAKQNDEVRVHQKMIDLDVHSVEAWGEKATPLRPALKKFRTL